MASVDCIFITNQKKMSFMDLPIPCARAEIIVYLSCNTNIKTKGAQFVERIEIYGQP